MNKQSQVTVLPATGKLGVLLVGIGAVSTTLVAGVELVRKGLGRPIGSITQMGTIRIGKRTDKNSPMIKDFVPLARLEDVVFGGWDIFPENAYEAAVHAGVIEETRLAQVRSELEALKPWPAVFDQKYVRRVEEPLDVLTEPENCRPFFRLITPDSLEDTETVVEGVREDMHSRIVPVNKLSIHPYFVSLFYHKDLFIPISH